MNFSASLTGTSIGLLLFFHFTIIGSSGDVVVIVNY